MDFREDIIGEMIIGGNPSLPGWYTNVRLINTEAFMLLWPLMSKHIFLRKNVSHCFGSIKCTIILMKLLNINLILNQKMRRYHGINAQLILHLDRIRPKPKEISLSTCNFVARPAKNNGSKTPNDRAYSQEQLQAIPRWRKHPSGQAKSPYQLTKSSSFRHRNRRGSELYVWAETFQNFFIMFLEFFSEFFRASHKNLSS